MAHGVGVGAGDRLTKNLPSSPHFALKGKIGEARSNMKIRRSQVVLIAFAVAAWLGAILELQAAAGYDECLEHAVNP